MFRNRKGRSDSVTAAVITAPPVGAADGFACSAPGCEAEHGWSCAYADTHARGCATMWCQAHIVPLLGRPLCRRHAGTLVSLGDGAAIRPDVDNRAPSLAGWVAAELDGPIREVLDSRRDAHSESIVSNPVHPAGLRGREQSWRISWKAAGGNAVHPAGLRGRRQSWRRSWKVVDHTGVKVAVSVQVDEAAADVVVLRVADKTVAEQVPPWIEARRGKGASPVTDADRGAFTRALQESVAAALGREPA